jgi:hypothetical protein
METLHKRGRMLTHLLTVSDLFCCVHVWFLLRQDVFSALGRFNPNSFPGSSAFTTQTPQTALSSFRQKTQSEVTPLSKESALPPNLRPFQFWGSAAPLATRRNSTTESDSAPPPLSSRGIASKDCCTVEESPGGGDAAWPQTLVPCVTSRPWTGLLPAPPIPQLHCDTTLPLESDRGIRCYTCTVGKRPTRAQCQFRVVTRTTFVNLL